MARFGGGHESLAKAMKDALEDFGEGEYQVAIEDGFPPIFSVSSPYGTFPFLADQGYRITNHAKIDRVIHSINTMLIGRHLMKLVRRNKPDMIISTHPLLTTEVKSVLTKFKRRIVFGVFFADAIAPHQFWFSERQADIYFAPTRECFSFALERQIPRDKMVYVGWILRKEFYEENFESATYKKNLGFNPEKKLIYLSGGGDGAGHMDEIVEYFFENKYFLENCQIAVICGTNHKLLVKLQKIQRKMPEIISSYGFIHNVYDFKKAADIICSKSGPNDMFESVMLGKPFFAHTWFWVHERDNLNFVKERKIGEVELNPKRMVRKILLFLREKAALDEKVHNVMVLREDHLDAPKTLVEKIREVLV